MRAFREQLRVQTVTAQCIWRNKSDWRNRLLSAIPTNTGVTTMVFGGDLMAVDANPVPPLADPAPLGLGAFALTTFILSAHNAFGAKTVPLLAFFGFGLFYGGLAQFMAGMFEFRNKNVFGATAFTTYGGFWLGLSAFVGLVLLGKVAPADVAPSLA